MSAPTSLEERVRAYTTLDNEIRTLTAAVRAQQAAIKPLIQQRNTLSAELHTTMRDEDVHDIKMGRLGTILLCNRRRTITKLNVPYMASIMVSTLGVSQNDAERCAEKILSDREVETIPHVRRKMPRP